MASSSSSKGSIDADRLSVNSHVPGGFPSSTDGASTPTSSSVQFSLSQAVYERRAEYTVPRTIKLKVGSWNVAAFKGTEKDLGGWFVGGQGVSQTLSGEDNAAAHSQKSANVEDAGRQEARDADGGSTLPHDEKKFVSGGEDVDLYVLGLQEVVDINSAVEALRPFTDSSAMTKYKVAMEDALPSGYKLVAEQQLIGLLLLIYASPDLAPEIHSVNTTSVGTGLMGYMGNKGAVLARIMLGDSRLVFVDCHLSAGSSSTDLARRVWDAGQIALRTRFEPVRDIPNVQGREEKIGDEDFAFWFGDLNFRLEGVPGKDVRKLLMLHTQNEYDNKSSSADTIREELAGGDKESRGEPHSDASDQGSDLTSRISTMEIRSQEATSNDPNDPTSLQATINSLIPHDELRQAQKTKKIFHDGWKEGEITFLPTYKYDPGTVGVFDSGEKKRGPSWCDRILYRSRFDRLQYEENLLLSEEAKKKDAQMQAQGIQAAAESEDTMFDYDPEADGDDEYDESYDPTDHPAVEEAHALPHDENPVLENYTSHQRVLSADHKPLTALFSLTFGATDRTRKAQIRDEIARDLDRAENEGRPVITVVTDDGQQGQDIDFNGISFGNVRYDEPKRRQVTLANTGRVPALVGFVNRPNSSRTSDLNQVGPKWLSVEFELPSEMEFETKVDHNDEDAWDHGIDKIFKFQPGDTINVELLSWIKDKEMVKSFNSGATMEDVLVLRVKDGRDHFLPIRGVWQDSVHGRLLDSLTRIPEGGVRALQAYRSARSQDRSSSEIQVKRSAPTELFILISEIESLVERACAECSMLSGADSRPPWLSQSGWPFVSESWTLTDEERQMYRVEVNESLDNGNLIVDRELSTLQRLEILCDVLLLFLHNLDDGIVTEEMWSDIDSKIFSKSKLSRVDMKSGALEILSQEKSHSTCFILITSMLSRVIQEIAAHFVVPFFHADSSSLGVDEIPPSPRVKVRRKTLDRDSQIASRQLMEQNIAAVFADILIRVRDQSRWLTTEPRRRELVGTFLDDSVI